MPQFTWGSMRRWATLAALLCATLLGSACAGLDLRNTDHTAGSPPEFALYVSGTQHIEWSQNTETNDNGCIAYGRGKAVETVTFALAKPVRVRAVQNNGHIEFRTIDLNHPLGEMEVTGAFDRTSTFHAGVEGTNCAGGGRGDGSGNGSRNDCGHRLLHSSVKILAGGNKMQVMSHHDTSEPTWRPEPFYEQCYMSASDELVGSDKADSAPAGPPGPITASVDVSQLLDAHNLHVVAKAHGTAHPQLPAGTQATITLDWTVTFCRLNSDLTFDEALRQAHDLLSKSPKFAQEMAPLQSAKRVGFEETTTAAYGEGGSTIRDADAPGKGAYTVKVAWNNMTTAAEMAEVIAHEIGHVTEDISRGDFSLQQAAPFLTREQFDTMGYEGELRAYRNELNVLRDIMRHDRDDQPCIQALIDAHPILHALDQGDEAGARRAIKSGYQPSYDDHYSSMHHANGANDLGPVVQQYLSSSEYQSAQAAWAPYR